MIRPDRDRQSGWIEVDEIFIGGFAEGVVEVGRRLIKPWLSSRLRPMGRPSDESGCG